MIVHLSVLMAGGNMTTPQRYLIASLWVVALLAALAFSGVAWRLRHRSAQHPGSPATGVIADVPADWAVPAFALTDQNDKPFTNADLAGHVWVVDFIFTRCQGPCPLLAQRMGEVQKAISDPRVKLLSLSVDGEYDTPAVLRQYARDHGAQEGRWMFATGKPSDVQAIALALKVAVPGDSPLAHTTKLILIDPQGHARGYYSSDDGEAMKKLPADAAGLAKTLGKAP